MEGNEKKVEVVLSAASPLSVADAAALSPAQQRLIERAAGLIEAGRKNAAVAAAAEKLKREQEAQTLAARKKRQAEAAK